ncbi:HAD-like domain-containing protein [Bipolaris maydis]|nr:HAD-like domain-containing protein [Bipolaris maydis]
MGREHLKTPSWWFFDLDDTLHEFRKASSSAPPTPQEDSVTFADLKAAYSKVLKETTSSAFTGGKTSHDYRAERFQNTLKALSLPFTPDQVAQILNVYKNALMQHLTLKPTIVTEGPQDAQQRTVAALGLEPYFDRLITTNAFGVAKVDGLFEKALEVLGVEGREVIMVGDSWDRDVVPAGKAGIRCVWYAEGCEEEEERKRVERVVVVDSLGKLREMVEEAELC